MKLTPAHTILVNVANIFRFFSFILCVFSFSFAISSFYSHPLICNSTHASKAKRYLFFSCLKSVRILKTVNYSAKTIFLFVCFVWSSRNIILASHICYWAITSTHQKKLCTFVILISYYIVQMFKFGIFFFFFFLWIQEIKMMQQFQCSSMWWIRNDMAIFFIIASHVNDNYILMEHQWEWQEYFFSHSL